MPEALSLLEAAAIGLYSVSPDGIIQFINAEAARLLNCEPTEVRGLNHHELFGHTCPAGNIYSSADCPLCSAVKNLEVLDHQHGKFTRSDGTTVPVEYGLRPFHMESASGSVITFRDMTEQ